MTFRPETVVAIDAVERALELTRLRVGATEITRKDDGDLVTATDVAVEDAVRNLIGKTLGLPVVGEERGGEAPSDRASYWLVDPICGTRNFAAGTPLFCVNVALVESNEITVAVVGDPSTDEILVAERGRGAVALKDGAPRRVTSSDASRTIVIEDSHAEGDRRDLAANFVAGVVRDNRWESRSLSSTLALAYVAAGRFAAYVLFWTSAVHAGAGSLLAAEAGATVTDIDGRPWTVDSDSLVAGATASVHHELLELALEAAPR